MPHESDFRIICIVSKETSLLISEPDKVLLSKLSTINRDVNQICSASNANESDKSPNVAESLKQFQRNPFTFFPIIFAKLRHAMTTMS
jgi:hypothetical protein